MSAYDQAKIKNPSPKQSLKRSLNPEEICVGRIRTFPFSSDSADNSVTYDVVKNRLSPESEAESLARRNLIRKNQNVSIFFRCSCDSVAYGLVKTRLSESEAEGER